MSDVIIRRTPSSDPTFAELIRQLDEDLWKRYGEVQGQYAPHNVLDTQTAVIAVQDGEPAGCGCFKEYEPGTAELKRVFVPPAFRHRGVARGMVAALEAWARELGYHTMILETGNLQHEAIALYAKLGYEQTPLFPPYVGMPASICMRKSLAPA